MLCNTDDKMSEHACIPEIERDRERDRDRHRHIHRQTDRQTDTDRPTDRQTDRQTDQTDRQTRQTDQTDRQTGAAKVTLVLNVHGLDKSVRSRVRSRINIVQPKETTIIIKAKLNFIGYVGKFRNFACRQINHGTLPAKYQGFH